jgi:hypothetical protein
MKKINLIFFGLITTAVVFGQDFSKSVASARSAYTAGNLEDARFNMENALRDIDIVIGKEILKVLPASLGSMASNTKDDNVTGMSGGLAGGLYVHRTYGKPTERNAVLDIISDSPLMAGVNAILSMPMIMNTGDANQKVVKIQGYKSLLTRQTNETGQTSGYDVQTPFGNSMLTLHCTGAFTEAEVTQLANGLPLEKIIKLAQ